MGQAKIYKFNITEPLYRVPGGNKHVSRFDIPVYYFMGMKIVKGLNKIVYNPDSLIYTEHAITQHRLQAFPGNIFHYYKMPARQYAKIDYLYDVFM